MSATTAVSPAAFASTNEHSSRVSRAAKCMICPTKLFLGGITKGTTTAQLRDHFSYFGRVLDCVAMRTSDGRPRGFGYVTLDSPAAAAQCLAEPQTINGRAIDMKRAVPEGLTGADPMVTVPQAPWNVDMFGYLAKENNPYSWPRLQTRVPTGLASWGLCAAFPQCAVTAKDSDYAHQCSQVDVRIGDRGCKMSPDAAEFIPAVSRDLDFQSMNQYSVSQRRVFGELSENTAALAVENDVGIDTQCKRPSSNVSANGRPFRSLFSDGYVDIDDDGDDASTTNDDETQRFVAPGSGSDGSDSGDSFSVGKPPSDSETMARTCSQCSSDDEASPALCEIAGNLAAGTMAEFAGAAIVTSPSAFASLGRGDSDCYDDCVAPLLPPPPGLPVPCSLAPPPGLPAPLALQD